MKRFVASLVALLSIVPIAFCQETSRPPKEAPLAMLALMVTDSKGKHVTALARDAFQVSIGGAPVNVEKFAERGAQGAPAGEMRRIAVLFDVTTLSPGKRLQTAEALHSFLARTLRPGDLAVILANGQSLRAVTTWTNNLAAIDAGLARLTSESSMPMGSGQAAAEKRIREIATDIQQMDEAARRHGRIGTLYTFEALVAAAREYAAASYRDSERSLGQISSAVSLFTPRTRNVLIVAGGGLPRAPGAAVFQYVESLRSAALRGNMGVALQSGAQLSSPMSESSSYDLTPLFDTVGTRSWRRGVAVYAIGSDYSDNSANSIEMQQSVDTLAAFTNSAARFAGYSLLADQTGGIAFVGRSPVDALNQVASDLESFYTIGVHPAAPIPGKSALSVNDRSGHAVRVLRGSSGMGTAADEMESRVVANQLIKPTDNELGISLNAAPPIADGEKRLVTVDVVIPIHKLKLVRDGSDVAGAFTVFIATGDMAGNSSSVNRQTKEVRWPADAVTASDKTLTFRVNVVLEPGRSQISVGVMDERSKEKGFDRVSV